MINNTLNLWFSVLFFNQISDLCTLANFNTITMHINLRKIQFLLLILVALSSISLVAQQKYTVSGYLTDESSGETLIGAYVYLSSDNSIGTVSNLYGFYSMTLDAGTYTINVSYVGYKSMSYEIDLSENLEFNVELSLEGITTEEIVVTDTRTDENVNDAKMGTVQMSVEKIKALPAFMGEVDILKTLQLLPGVQSVGEGNGGFYVRGGGPNQNLILLDDATVYNGGHLFGFFSVFNADAIKNTTLYKGGMPAEYGGRISSVLDISMKEGNKKKFQVDGGIGLISSRLTLQGPILKGKTSFLVSGRRTYILDLMQPYIDKTDLKGTNYYFYDLNAKINHTFSKKDRLYLSGYFGRDVFSFKSNDRGFNLEIPWGNATTSLRWNHLFTDKLFMNTTLLFNDYNFEFTGGQNEGEQNEFSFNLYSGIRDFSLKSDIDFYPTPKHKFKFGAHYTYHIFTPSITNFTSGDTDFEPVESKRYAHEAAIYLQDNFDLTDKIKVEMGLRGSFFQQVGPYDRIDKSEGSLDTIRYENLEPVKSYGGLEPRINVRYKLDNSSSIKASVAKTNQYVHLVSSSASTLPTDVWVPSSDIVRPQTGIQYAIGYFKNFKENNYEGSVELFYRDINNIADYADDYVPELGENIEDNFAFGYGKAYGAEFFLKKNFGKFNGWLGYTYTKTENIFDGSLENVANPDLTIDNGEAFVTNYDRPHDVSVALNYQLNEKWQFGGIFVYASDKPYTPAIGTFTNSTGSPGIIYGKRNSARIRDYHRLDFSATFTPKPNKTKGLISTFNFSAFNVYARKNLFFIFFDTEQPTDESVKITPIGISLVPTIIPSVTWNFKF